jgi:hypothetical protein
LIPVFKEVSSKINEKAERNKEKLNGGIGQTRLGYCKKQKILSKAPGRRKKPGQLVWQACRELKFLEKIQAIWKKLEPMV